MIGNLILDYNPFKLGLNAILYVNNILSSSYSSPNLYNYLKLPSENNFLNTYKLLIFNLDEIINTEESIISIRNNFNKIVDSEQHDIIIISNITSLDNYQIKRNLTSKQFNINNVKIICVQDVILSYIKKIISIKKDDNLPISLGIIASSNYYNSILLKIYKKYTINDIKLYLLNKNEKIIKLDCILVEDINTTKNISQWFNFNKDIPIILSKNNSNLDTLNIENPLDFTNNHITYLIKPMSQKLKIFIKNKYNLEDNKKMLYISNSLEDDYEYTNQLEIDLAYIPSLKNIHNIINIDQDIHHSIKYILPDISFLNYYKIKPQSQ